MEIGWKEQKKELKELKNCKTFCHSRGGGNPALVSSVRDDTDKALQYRHLSAVLTELINGLDSCLRRNDKTFSHKLIRENDRSYFSESPSQSQALPEPLHKDHRAWEPQTYPVILHWIAYAR
ncbi:MAG: hypothetical protein RBS43_04250 [Candidatus Cloacimonas sp.]|nr:hypothetical protein [Candidatus Cloacimonas sp.]